MFVITVKTVPLGTPYSGIQMRYKIPVARIRYCHPERSRGV